MSKFAAIKYIFNTFIFFSILVSLNCHADKKFPIESKSILDYYQKDCHSNAFEFYLYPKLQLSTKSFNEQESLIPIKAEYFSFNTVNTNIRYFEAYSFNIDDFHYKLIIYNRFGEGDVFYFNVQLNSYNSNGKLVDALLLDSRYGFEGNNFFREFSINKNGEIDIFYNIIKLYEMNDNDEIYEIKDPTSATLANETYKIENGKFILIKHEGEDL